MNAINLLLNWPRWSDKKASDILFSPAWAMRVRWGDEEATLRLSNNRPRDIIALKISLDDEEHFLGISDRAVFPDLSALWDRKNEIPQSLVLALVEKECGKLLQLVENALRRQLTVIGLTSVDERADTQGFEITGKDGSIIASFALNVSPMVEESLGDVAAIDANHSSIRDMTRPGYVEYATFILGSDASSLASGDYLIVPELENPSVAKWFVERPLNDGKYHVRAASSYPLAFAAFADDALPAIPKPDVLELYFGSRLIATGRATTLGGQCAFAVEEVI
jgi:hypothetical protein